MNGKIKIRDILMLQIVFFIYSINSVVAKLASAQESFGIKFILLYGLEAAILGVYAILWQQIIKKLELSIAYANKAVVLIWAMIWGALLFEELITLPKMAGILLVILGIIILNSGIASFSQILLKKSAEKTYNSIIREYLNPYVICGYGMMFLSMFLTIIAYSGMEFTNVQIVEATGYIMVLILSYFFFREKITKRKLLGMIFIFAGIAVYYL